VWGFGKIGVAVRCSNVRSFSV